MMSDEEHQTPEHDFCPNIDEDEDQTDDTYQKNNWKFPNNDITEKQQPVLEPDHPLLQKFQKSLKEHLLRVKNQLTDDIADLDYNIKNKEKERENVGAKLYDMQQEIKRQNQILEEYTKQIEESDQNRIESEKNTIPLKKEYNEKLLTVKNIKHSHNERIMELARLQTLESNIMNWTREIDDELTTAKLTVSKDYQDQKMLSESKKQTDLLLHNMETQVRAKEHELEIINDQITEQTKIMDVLNYSITDATSDLEVLQKEHKKLTIAWNDVIIAIQHRDKILFQTKNKLKATKEEYKLTCASIVGTQKAAAKEMEQNEKLELFKKRINEDLQGILKQTDKETEKLDKLENKLDEINLLIEHSEKDLTKAKQEGNALQVEMGRIQSQLDKQAVRKFKVEEQILLMAQEQLTADKASEYRMKLLRQSQQQRRSMELTLAKCEKNISQTLLDLEKWKGIVLKLKEEKEKYLDIYNEQNSIADAISTASKQLELSSVSKGKQIDVLTKKLESALDGLEGKEMDPLERRAVELDREIEECESEIRNQQHFWLIMQGHVVNLTEKRAAQMNELQIVTKQIMILAQKSLRVDHDLEHTEKSGIDIMKIIRTLSVKFEILNRQLVDKKKHHQLDEHDCEMIHSELLEKLKVSEMSVLQLEQEICQLTNEVGFCKELVLEKHREALSWETKYKLIEDTIRWYRGERSLESEIGNMKAEIHRMEIRYQQLKRAQEKLIQDMENCVLHRTQIFDSAMIKQKMDGNQSRTRLTIQYKLNDLKNKIKSIQQEIQENEKQINELSQQSKHVIQQICTKQEECENERQRDILIMNEIEHGMLLKHQNLENIIRKQHRAKHYRCLSCMRMQPKNIKPVSVLEQLIQKQKDIHDNLIEILHNLIPDHPDKKFFLLRILQSLKDD